jgi:hypothetical protein
VALTLSYVYFSAMGKYTLNGHVLFLMKLAYGIGFIYLGLITESLILLALIITLYFAYVFLELKHEIIKIEISNEKIKLFTIFKQLNINKTDLDIMCLVPKKESAFTHKTIVFNKNFKIKSLYWNKKTFAELLKELDAYGK